ncbi:MAG TPA: glycosyltransferase [Alphaproteobacteria bacterium]|jgi:glycosyltransferase involved in cell wall biosynthesis
MTAATMDIVMIDDGIAFDGRTPEEKPLGGAESAFVSLAAAFAGRGHRVRALTNGGRRLHHGGVEWGNLRDGAPERADLYIANRGDRLLRLVPKALTTVFWIHNPAGYLRKWRYLSKLWRRQPILVFLGAFHAATHPSWLPPRRTAIIPHAVDDLFRKVVAPVTPPVPRAIFTSNPLRGLDWLLDLWTARVRPRLPTAELHVFSSAATYGAVGAAKAHLITPVIEQARGLAGEGVVLRAALPKAGLAAELAMSRVFLHPGTADETYCFAAAEAQAAGVPAVVGAVGAMPERVRDGATGFVVADVPGGGDAAYADRVVNILGDDETWRRLRDGALATQRARGWNEVAADFEALCHGR